VARDVFGFVRIFAPSLVLHMGSLVLGGLLLTGLVLIRAGCSRLVLSRSTFHPNMEFRAINTTSPVTAFTSTTAPSSPDCA